MKGLQCPGAGAMLARTRPSRAPRRCRPVVQPLDARVLLSASAVEPTAYEQYMLELINRARANPAAEAQRLLSIATTDPLIKSLTASEDLSQFVQALTSYGPEPPLAFSPDLIQMARSHDAAMLAANTQFHSPIGSNLSSYGENIYAYSSVITSPDPTAAIDFFDEAFFLDWGNPDFGHLKNLMWPGPAEDSNGINEIGIGLMTNAVPSNPPAPNSAYPDFNVGPDLITQEFGSSGGNAFLTGVVFQNSTNTGVYAPGAGFGGTGIQAIGLQGQGIFQTVTWDSGGYSLPLPPGTYDVTATGGVLLSPQTTAVTIGADNVEWDVRVAPTNLATPAPTGLSPNPSPAPTPATAPTPSPVPIIAPTLTIPPVKVTATSRLHARLPYSYLARMIYLAGHPHLKVKASVHAAGHSTH